MMCQRLTVFFTMLWVGACTVDGYHGDAVDTVGFRNDENTLKHQKEDCGCGNDECQGDCDREGCPGAVKPSTHAAADEKSSVAALDLEDAPRKGLADAEVTIVMASDFECPFCARVNGTLAQIIEKYGERVTIVYRHNPLAFHKNGMEAAVAAEAAHRQGKFWEMYELLFAHQRELSRANYLALAERIGLDMDTFSADLSSAELKARVAKDQKAIKALGGRGVPSFWINGRRLVGAQPLAVFEKMIDEELAK